MINKPNVDTCVAREAYLTGLSGYSKEVSFEENDPRIAEYESDPDQFAATAFGVSKFDYIEWIKFDGYPRCKARTKKNALCANPGCGQFHDAREFVKNHRRFYCAMHQVS